MISIAAGSSKRGVWLATWASTPALGRARVLDFALCGRQPDVECSMGRPWRSRVGNASCVPSRASHANHTAPNAHADACRGRATLSPMHAPHAPRVVWDGEQEAGGQGAGLRRPASECSRRTTETFLTRASEGGCAKPERGSTREAPSPARRTEPDAAAQKLPDKAAGVPISPVRHPRSVIKGRNGPSWQASTADVATGKTRGMTLGGRAASLIASC